jgi:hypothetical protein
VLGGGGGDIYIGALDFIYIDLVKVKELDLKIYPRPSHQSEDFFKFLSYVFMLKLIVIFI